MSTVPTTPSEQRAAANDSGSLLPFVLAVAVLVAMLYGGWKWWQVQQFELARSKEMPASQLRIPLTDFELTERSGETFHSEEMGGKVWVANYFFSSCIGTCLTVNENIARLNRRPDLSDVTWVSITCDPDNDSLDVLRTYAKRWESNPNRWLFCRGDFEYTKGVARGMNIPLAMKLHSDHAVVIDKTGTVRGLFDATSRYECDRMRTLLTQCLEENPLAEVRTADAVDTVHASE